MEAPDPGSDSSRHESDTAGTAVSAKMVTREAKEQRLRKLQDDYDYVRVVVSHMEKHYSTAEPPPWLDLRAVAGQIARSSRNSTPCGHAAWKGLRESMAAVKGWMQNHGNWRDAVEVSRMPHIGTASEIKAAEFIKGEAHFPESLMKTLREIKLDFLLDTLPPSEDKVPGFWKGAELNSPEWRNVYMRPGYHRHIPFADDLTDLVLSTVCQKGSFGHEGAQSSSTCAVAEENDEEAAFSNNHPETEKHSVEPLEEEHTSRNANEVGKRCMAEHANTLEKRCRQEDNETGKPEVRQKRQKTGERALQPQKTLDKVEDRGDNRSSIFSSAAKATVAKEELRALKVGYKKLKKQDQQLAALCANLEERNRKLEVEAEQLTEQHQNLRKDHDTEKQKYQHVAEKCDELDRQNKKREDKAQQVAVQCAALTDDVRKLEDKSGQLAAQYNAFEDENKILRAQLVNLMSRVEALEQAQSALSHQVEPAPPSAPAPVDRSEQVEATERGHTGQRSAQGVSHTDKISPALQHNIRGAGDPPAPSLQWQSAGTDKYENMDNLVMDQPTPCHHKRAGSRFPRVLEMPTFEPAWDPQQEVSSHRTPANTRPLRPTAYSNTFHTPLASTTSYRHTDSAVKASTQHWNLVRPPAPVQMSAPASAQIPTAAPMRAFTNTDPSASANEKWRETETESHTTAPNTNRDREPSRYPQARLPQHQQRHDRQQHQPPSNTHAHTVILDPRLWPSAAATASAPEIPVHGQAQGLPHDRLGKLMERFQQMLGAFLGDQGGDGQGQGQGQVDDLPAAGTGGECGEDGEEGGYCLAAPASEVVAGDGEGDGE